MPLPEHLSIEAGYARFCPQARVTLPDAVALISGAIEFCREQKISKLLVDVTGLAGLSSPTVVERFWFVRKWAKKARGLVTVALVAPAELIDPRKFGVTVARNLGLTGDVFTSTSAAVDWLSGRKAE